MQQPIATAAAVLPCYAEWLTPDQVAAQVGASAVVVNAWIVTGIKTEAGRLRLRAVKIGGRWKIDPAAVAEFVSAVTAASLPPSATAPAGAPAPPKPETEADRVRRAAQCMARLKARGVLTEASPQPRTRRA